MPKYNRTIDPNAIGSGLDAATLTFNPQSGANKTLPTGPHLLPIPVGTTWTTSANGAPVNLPRLGLNIAVYNNAGAVGTITIGNTPGIASLGIGAVDIYGNAGVPCPPNSWTYLSMGYNQWIITSAATMFVFLFDDSTFVQINS